MSYLILGCNFYMFTLALRTITGSVSIDRFGTMFAWYVVTTCFLNILSEGFDLLAPGYLEKMVEGAKK